MSRRDRRNKPEHGMPKSGSGVPVLPEIDYTKFGPRGAEFQSLYRDTWDETEKRWNQQPAQIGIQGVRVDRVPMDNVLNLLDRSYFLFSALMGASRILGAMDPDRCVRLWEQLKQQFVPPLRSGQQLAGNLQNLILLSTLMVDCILEGAQMEAGIFARRWQLNMVSHGPFSAHEMQYLWRNHPRLLEVGCGSAYFAYEFFRHGGDVVAHDSNKYGFTEGFVWTRKLSRAGRLIVTPDARRLVRDNADRALIVSWPEPGSTWLPDVLEAYAEAGGEVFILKFGGYVGAGFSTMNANYKPPENVPDNIWWFFQLLSEDWEQATPHPPWIPRMFNNNLFVFRRRSH